MDTAPEGGGLIDVAAPTAPQYSVGARFLLQPLSVSESLPRLTEQRTIPATAAQHERPKERAWAGAAMRRAVLAGMEAASAAAAPRRHRGHCCRIRMPRPTASGMAESNLSLRRPGQQGPAGANIAQPCRPPQHRVPRPRGSTSGLRRGHSWAAVLDLCQ